MHSGMVLSRDTQHAVGLAAELFVSEVLASRSNSLVHKEADDGAGFDFLLEDDVRQDGTLSALDPYSDARTRDCNVRGTRVTLQLEVKGHFCAADVETPFHLSPNEMHAWYTAERDPSQRRRHFVLLVDNIAELIAGGDPRLLTIYVVTWASLELRVDSYFVGKRPVMKQHQPVQAKQVNESWEDDWDDADEVEQEVEDDDDAPKAILDEMELRDCITIRRNWTEHGIYQDILDRFFVQRGIKDRKHYLFDEEPALKGKFILTLNDFKDIVFLKLTDRPWASRCQKLQQFLQSRRESIRRELNCVLKSIAGMRGSCVRFEMSIPRDVVLFNDGHASLLRTNFPTDNSETFLRRASACITYFSSEEFGALLLEGLAVVDQEAEENLVAPPRSNQPCNHWVNFGSCKYGDTCRYSHPDPPGKGRSGKDPSERSWEARAESAGYEYRKGQAWKGKGAPSTDWQSGNNGKGWTGPTDWQSGNSGKGWTGKGKQKPIGF